MSSARLYRVASVLLVLFAVAHSFGFRQVDPRWNADATVAAMKLTFQVQGQTRSYWDFFSGFGFFCTGLLLFSAILAWELGALPTDVLYRLKRVRWAFAACFVALTIVTWRYIFPAPTTFTALVALVLVLAARQGAEAKRESGA
jgi:hypothetical protein